MKTLKGFIAGLACLTAVSGSYAAQTLPTVTVYKTATCSCCKAWVSHLEDNGFTVESHDVANMQPYKEQANLPNGLASCHTGFVNGYAVEGHVPASDIKRLLEQAPAIRGIAVPGMPMGSPGMEYGDRKDAYQTVGYTKAGAMTVFASH